MLVLYPMLVLWHISLLVDIKGITNKHGVVLVRGCCSGSRLLSSLFIVVIRPVIFVTSLPFTTLLSSTSFDMHPFLLSDTIHHSARFHLGPAGYHHTLSDYTPTPPDTIPPLRPIPSRPRLIKFGTIGGGGGWY